MGSLICDSKNNTFIFIAFSFVHFSLKGLEFVVWKILMNRNKTPCVLFRAKKLIFLILEILNKPHLNFNLPLEHFMKLLNI